MPSAPKFKGIRYYNRTGADLCLPTPTGGRHTLAPNEFVTSPYYQRFARHPHEEKVGLRSLTIEGCEVVQATAVELTAPVIPERPPVVADAPMGGCDTSCESACQFPAEMDPATPETINRQMDLQQGDELPHTATPATVVLGSETMAPEAPSPDAVRLQPAELVEMKTVHGFQDDQIMDMHPDFVKVMGSDGKPVFYSRLVLTFSCRSEKEMRGHVKSIKEAPAKV